MKRPLRAFCVIVLLQSFLSPAFAGPNALSETPRPPSGLSAEELQANQTANENLVANQNAISALSAGQKPPLPEVLIRVPGSGFSFNTQTNEFEVLVGQVLLKIPKTHYIKWFLAGQAMLRYAGRMSDTAEARRISGVLNDAMGAEAYVTLADGKTPAYGKYGKMIVASDLGSGYTVLDTQTKIVYVGTMKVNSPSFSESDFEDAGKYLYYSTEMLSSVFYAQAHARERRDIVNLYTIAVALKQALGTESLQDIRDFHGVVLGKTALDKDGKPILSYFYGPYHFGLSQLNVVDPNYLSVKNYSYDVSKDALTYISTFTAGNCTTTYTYDVTTHVRVREQSFDPHNHLMLSDRYYDRVSGNTSRIDLYFADIGLLQQSKLYDPDTQILRSATYYRFYNGAHTKANVFLFDVLGRLEYRGQYDYDGNLLFEYFYRDGSTVPYKRLHYVNGVPYEF
ncbi:MAG TPA: hypothetical protein VL404_08010 [Candidatus Eisenbacteria bacterium]|jgi:hypothetical protein|nr:hypothetical protein [Candidatus Eisenbacteria bacterium]